LNHPEPTTPIGAAEILGRLRAPAARPALGELARRPVAARRPEAFRTAAALRGIGDASVEALLQCFLRPDLPFLIRRAAQEALNTLHDTAQEETTP